MSTAIVEGLNKVGAAVDAASDAVKNDAGASPVAAAVVEEFARKTQKALSGPSREAVIELEQAGDSAKAAAEADTGMGDSTRQLVLDAHLSICMLKATL